MPRQNDMQNFGCCTLILILCFLNILDILLFTWNSTVICLKNYFYNTKQVTVWNFYLSFNFMAKTSQNTWIFAGDRSWTHTIFVIYFNAKACK